MKPKETLGTMTGTEPEMIGPLRFPASNKGQSLVEMGLVLPIILLLAFGAFEFGRILFIYSAVNNASREAARFGAASGTSTGGTPRYLDCFELRAAARAKAFFADLSDDEIEIGYDTPNISGTMTIYATCDEPGLRAEDIKLGDRIVVTVTETITPILSILPIENLSMTSVTARTILKDIGIGPVECSDGFDNDGDGLTDYDKDDGCDSPDDTVEALCHAITIVGAPTEGGSLEIVPGPNCSNRYIEQSVVNLRALPAPRYVFDYWRVNGITTTTSLTTTVVMNGSQEVVAHFRLREADLAVSKQASPDPVDVSTEWLRYTIVASNPVGPEPATSVVVTDTLPAGVTFYSAPGCSHPIGNVQTVVCELVGALEVGASYSWFIDVVAPATKGTITNTVVVDAFEYDPNLANNTFVQTTTVIPVANLKITKSASANSVYAGDSFTYNIDVTNEGPSPATGVVITDTLPDGVSFLSSAECNLPGGRTVVCNVGNLSDGAVAAVSINVQAPNHAGVINNQAFVDGNEVDRELSNNVSNVVSTTILSRANLSLQKTGPLEVWRDQSYTYALQVTNGGPSLAPLVILTDTLPAGVRFDGWSGDASTCIPSGQVVTCDLGDLVKDAIANISLTVTPEQTGVITNTAEVRSGVLDQSLNNNSASATTTVEAGVDLAIDQTGPTTAEVDATLTYALSVVNDGPSVANNVIVRDSLPISTTFSSASSQCTYSLSNHEVICTVAQLAQSASIDFWIAVVPTSGGTIHNTATVSTDQEGELPNSTGNNADTVSTDVVAAMRGAIRPAVGFAHAWPVSNLATIRGRIA